MNRPHKEEIIAWANGAELQYKGLDGVFIDYDPSDFSPYLTIRIKPDVADTPEQIRQDKIAALREQIANLEVLGL